MNNPMKRAIVMAVAALLLVLSAYFIPGVKEGNLGNFLKGGSVGLISVAALMVVVAITQQPKVSENEK